MATSVSRAILPRINVYLFEFLLDCFQHFCGIIIREDSDEILKAVLKGSKGISESQVLRRLADMAFDAGDFEEALKSYSEALATDENDADAWCGRGLTLRKMGRFEEALEAYDRALRIDPNREDARHGRDACAKEEAAK